MKLTILIALSLLVAGCGRGDHREQRTSARAADGAAQLEGVWLFREEINTTPMGEVVAVPGPAYEGMLIYTRDGHVSVNLMPKGRKWTLNSASLDDFRQTVGGSSSTGYAGRYEVDVETGKVTHTPAVSLDPEDEGRRLVRSYVLDDDTLELSGTWTYEGRELVFTAIWARAGK
jgi:Lipocalin-like domain